MRRRIIQLADHPHNFCQLVHQLSSVLKATCRVDDQYIRSRGRSLFHRRVSKRCGISTLTASDHFGSRAFTPDLQLFYGGGAKSITSSQHHAFALAPPLLSKFAGSGCLSRPIDPDKQDYMRPGIITEDNRDSNRFQNFSDTIR